MDAIFLLNLFDCFIIELSSLSLFLVAKSTERVREDFPSVATVHVEDLDDRASLSEHFSSYGTLMMGHLHHATNFSHFAYS